MNNQNTGISFFKIFFSILLSIWTAFSFYYIINIQWLQYQEKNMTDVYDKARYDTINQIIEEANKCNQFDIYSGEKSVSILKVGC